jgi:PTH1 family peptidyl-tRNA hydrolase
VSPFGRDRRGTPADLLVVGLGTPGKEYAGTRHNVGVEVIEELARRAGTALGRSKERALVAVARLGGRESVVLAFPQTYMNLSGESVALLVKRHGISEPEQVVVVHDELDLPPGVLKVKVGGGLAGHNGLRSIAQHLHTDAFVRVRIGVGKPPSAAHGADHVLKAPAKADREAIAVTVQVAADAVEAIAAEGPAKAMNRFNTR